MKKGKFCIKRLIKEEQIVGDRNQGCNWYVAQPTTSNSSTLVKHPPNNTQTNARGEKGPDTEINSKRTVGTNAKR